MVGFSDVAHCDPCGTCEVNCIFFVYDESMEETYFDLFTIISGTFTEDFDAGVPYHETTGAGAFFYATAITYESWMISARFKYTPSGTSTSIWRVVGQAADISNYLFAELTIFGTVGDYHYNLKIGQVTSGADTFLATLEDGGDAGIVTEEELEDILVELCYNSDGVLTGSCEFEGTGTGVLSKRDVTAPTPSDYSGINVIAMEGTLRIFGYTIILNYNEDTTHCPDCTLSCAEGLPAREFDLEIDDATPITSIAWRFGVTATCVSLNGTFNFTMGDITPCAAVITDVGSDGYCSWYSGPHVADPPFAEPGPFEFGVHTYTLYFILRQIGEFGSAPLGYYVLHAFYIEDSLDIIGSPICQEVGRYRVRIVDSGESLPMEYWDTSGFTAMEVTPMNISGNFKCGASTPDISVQKIS